MNFKIHYFLGNQNYLSLFCFSLLQKMLQGSCALYSGSMCKFQNYRLIKFQFHKRLQN